MRISPVSVPTRFSGQKSNSKNTAFKGLMYEKTYSGHENSYKVDYSNSYYNYYPFKNETSEDIDKAKQSLPNNVKPALNGRDWTNSAQHIFKLNNELDFTKDEYDQYLLLNEERSNPPHTSISDDDYIGIEQRMSEVISENKGYDSFKVI